MAGFVAASALRAAAGSAGELIAARAAQGALGAIMLPQVFGLIRDLFEEHEMGRAFGVYGPVMGLSAMLGPIASGGLIGADVLGAGWRMIFLVNVPVGLLALVLGAGSGVGTVDLLAPMVVGGIGMGMVFVPLFDIVMAGVRPREMGSASGVLQTVNALGMSLGIAGLGAIFFALAGGHGRHVPVYLGAAEWTALATVGLLACSFAVAFGLPRRARETGAPADHQ